MIPILYVAFYNADVCVCSMLEYMWMCVLDHCAALDLSVWVKKDRRGILYSTESHVKTTIGFIFCYSLKSCHHTEWMPMQNILYVLFFQYFFFYRLIHTTLFYSCFLAAMFLFILNTDGGRDWERWKSDLVPTTKANPTTSTMNNNVSKRHWSPAVKFSFLEPPSRRSKYRASWKSIFGVCGDSVSC